MARGKSAFVKSLGAFARVLPGDHFKTFVYLNLIKAPRSFMRNVLNTFYRMDHIYDVINEFKNEFSGNFSILEFGVADGYSFRKILFATQYLKMADRVTVHGFDTFEGMPPTTDQRDKSMVTNVGWVEAQFRSDYEKLDEYCKSRFSNYQLHKGLFEDSLTDAFLETLRERPPMLIWMDADYYSSTVSALRKLVPYIPTGCVIYFDEPEFNYGSRFTGEARAIHELNAGLLGSDIELVRDRALSLDSQRIYRFIQARSDPSYTRLPQLFHTGPLRQPANDSPLP